MKKIFVFGVIAAFVTITLSACCGCRGAKSKNPHYLTVGEWKMVELYGKHNVEPVEDNFFFSIDSAQMRVAGKGSCNRFFGGVKMLPGHRIEFSKMGSTRMMCPDQGMENNFLKMLSEVNSYVIDQDMLMLQKDGDVVAIFQNKPLRKE